MALAAPGAEPYCKDWIIGDIGDQASTSDHEMIESKWTGVTARVVSTWKIRRWALRVRLENEKGEEWTDPRLENVWHAKSGARPILSGNCTLKELEWIMAKLADILNEHHHMRQFEGMVEPGYTEQEKGPWPS